MTFTVEIVLRNTEDAIVERIDYEGREPADWTEADVREVLTRILLAIDRAKNPGGPEPPVSLRGFSWIVEPLERGVTDQVVIALEIPMGAAVAGPFAIEQRVLDRLIGRVLASPPGGAVH
ncbi:MAG TPA: hypothetical protein VNI83_00970 [Vicinamibacterales bacterium]|nr:hypothetical protein [Vicinamibacterales bacterium]